MSDQTTTSNITSPQLPAKLIAVTGQVKVTDQYRIEFVTALEPYFRTLQDWDTRIKAFKAQGSFTDEDMAKAGEGRKLIQQKRIQAMKIIANARKIIQDGMADYKNADTLWLRGGQNLEADCKAYEKDLQDIEETREREERDARMKLRSARRAEIDLICSNPDIYPLGEMSEGDFKNLYATLKLQHEQLAEAERKFQQMEAEQEAIAKAAEEKLRQENARMQRKHERVKKLLQLGVKYITDPELPPVFTYPPEGVIIESELGDLDDLEFDLIFAEASAAIKAQKEASEMETARILAEQALERDRVHQEAVDKAVKEAQERVIAEAKRQAEEEKSEKEKAINTVLAAPLSIKVDDTPGPQVSMKGRLKDWVAGLQFPEPVGEYTGKGLKEVKNARDGFETWRLFVAERIEKL